jgi:hypothetical protein
VDIPHAGVVIATRARRFRPDQAGRSWARQSVDVAIVAGAFANPKGRPRRKNSAAATVAQLPELTCRPGTRT